MPLRSGKASRALKGGCTPNSSSLAGLSHLTCMVSEQRLCPWKGAAQKGALPAAFCRLWVCGTEGRDLGPPSGQRATPLTDDASVACHAQWSISLLLCLI